MPWQELGAVSQADISMDADGYVHFTRTFKVWDVTRTSFYSHLDTITQIGTNVTLPQYGHEIAVTLPNGAYGPFLSASGGDNGGGSVKAAAKLHSWRLQPSTAAVFVAIADYSNDPRLVPGGVHYNSDQQQAMVSIPYLRRASVAVGDTPTSFGYYEDAFNNPMGVESITHTTVYPLSKLKEAETIVSDRVNQLHQLPIKPYQSPCLYLGADIKMRGPQWLDITHRWQWQQGLNSASAFSDLGEEIRYFNMAGISVNPDTGTGDFKAALVPHRVKPLNETIFGSQYYIVPPYHEIKLQVQYEFRVTGGVEVKFPVPLWYYRMPFKGSSADLIGWKSLPGAKNFIWGGGLG